MLWSLFLNQKNVFIVRSFDDIWENLIICASKSEENFIWHSNISSHDWNKHENIYTGPWMIKCMLYKSTKSRLKRKQTLVHAMLIKKKDTAMKSKYLKFTFKSKRNTADIWRAIAWNIKKSVHFLTKNDRMNFDIYIDQMLNALKLSFYDKCVKKRDFMIYMNDETDYHISKKMIAWKRFVKLKRMNWLIQSPNLNPIENLWRLIKLRINEKRHQIHTLNEMKRIIQKEWKLLMKKNFRRAIKSMPDCCRTVIKAKSESIKYWFNFWISDRFWFIYKSSHFIRKFLHEMMRRRRRGKKKQFQKFSKSYDHLCYPIVHYYEKI